MDALRLDGNAAAGVFREIFAADITTAVGVCDGCGTADAVGAVHVYESAGTVLRCPHCNAVLMRVVVGEARVWVDLRGVRSLELRFTD
jgi:ribosomal protein S27E